MMNPNSKRLNELFCKMQSISELSKTNAKLCAYIQKHYMQIIFMTASQLADAVGISQGSVSRFCINLEFKGYNDFLKKLQEYVSKEITLPQRLAFTAGADADVSAIFTSERDNLDKLQELVKTPEYEQLKNQMISAKNIVLLSARMSATLLPYIFYLLNNVRTGVTQITPGSPAWDTLPLMNPKNTLIVAFVFPRYSNLLLSRLRELKEAGFKIEVVTDVSFPYLLASEFNHVRVPTTVSSIFDIYSTPLLFLNLLVRDVAKQTKGVTARMKSLEEMDKKEKIYYKTE